MTIPTTISEVRAELERRAGEAERSAARTRNVEVARFHSIQALAHREAAALLSAAEAREGVMREALERISSCDVRTPGDVVDIARKALGGTDAQH